MSLAFQQAFIAILFFVFPVTGAPKTVAPQVRFLNEQIIEADDRFQGLPVGGISGASYDDRTKRFFFLSDDKKNHRFYELRLNSQKPYRLRVTKQIVLREGHSPRLKRNMDPEALVFYPGKNALFVASEGQQVFALPEGPQIYQFHLDGLLQEAWPIPFVFWGRKKNFGPKSNKGFESLALDSQNHILWTATEESLRQDSIFSSNQQWIRISGFSLKSQKLFVQHGYRTKNPTTGLVEMLFLHPLVFLTLEREYIPSKKVAPIDPNMLSVTDTKRRQRVDSKSVSRRFSKSLRRNPNREGVYKLQLFLTDCNKASHLPLEDPLLNAFVACRKELLFDFSRLPGVLLDNLEAMTFGPWISSQKRLLVIASDNNFRPQAQKNQILFFEFFKSPLFPYKK